MNQETKDAIIKHGETLKKMFRLSPEIDSLKLCKQLRRLERQADKNNTDYCNGYIDETQYSKIDEAILSYLDAILNFNSQNIPVFINGDPRGYALKVNDEFMRAFDNISRNEPKSIFYGLSLNKDWGGYGILAPEINIKKGGY